VVTREVESKDTEDHRRLTGATQARPKGGEIEYGVFL